MTTAPKRRWLAFSLRTLFVAVTVVCVSLGWRLHAASQNQAIYARLAEQRVTITKLPDERDYASEMEYCWECMKEALGFERVYEVWVDFNGDDPRPDLKSNLLALRAIHPRAHFWGNFRGCGQPIDIDSLAQ